MDKILIRGAKAATARIVATKATTATRQNGQSRVQKRLLNIQEYQSKQLMNRFGVNTQRFRVADTPAEAEKAADELKAKELVIKAQILAGGRGKGHFIENGFKGGVHLCNTGEEAKKLASNMLGYSLVTKQTHANGVKVQKLMIAESINIQREVYFSIVMDRAYGGPVMIASPKGGMDIEQVAEEDPKAIFKEAIDIMKGPQPEQLLRLARALQFDEALVPVCADQLKRIYDLFLALDCTQVEVNPLAETDDKRIFAVDAKINFDDNALFRHKDIYEMRDIAEEDPREVEAEKVGLNYIGMDGNIGCMVNGAGLAMATMDIIKLYGGNPANFLDVGGGATEGQVTEAFKILTRDPQVKAIMVNIFGGIMKCDVIARGIVGAARTVHLNLPLVVRLSGTNVELGKKILQESGLPIIAADNLDDAAQKAVASMKK